MAKKKFRRIPKKNVDGKAEADGVLANDEKIAEIVEGSVSRENSSSPENPVSENGLYSNCPHVVLCRNLTTSDLDRAKQV